MKLFLLVTFLYIYLINHFHKNVIDILYKNQYHIVSRQDILEENLIIAKIKYSGWVPFYKSPSSRIFPELDLTVVFNSDSEFNVMIIPSKESGKVWIPPQQEPFPKDNSDVMKEIIMKSFDVEIISSPFRLIIKRKLTKEKLFDTNCGLFILSEHYNEISTCFNQFNHNVDQTDIEKKKMVFGLGERNHNYKLEQGKYTLWNKDQPNKNEDRVGDGNLYSSHPVYLMKESSNNFHIAYLRNTNAMEIEITENNKNIIFRILGGGINFKFFLGEKNPNQCIKLYHKYIGGYILHPFWSFGFHQSRWGFRDINSVDKVINEFVKNNLPIDTIWFDIDYMYDKVPTRFDGRFSKENINWLQSRYPNLNLVFIIEAGVSSLPDWDKKHLDLGTNLDVFIKNKNKNYLLGRVWGGRMYFPDFFHPNSTIFWNSVLEDTFEGVSFSGIWLDMNEPALFLDGECQTNLDCKINKSPGLGEIFKHKPFGTKCGLDYNQIYLPGGNNLEKSTICPNALHYNKYNYDSLIANDYIQHSDVHNLFGLMQSKETYYYLKDKGFYQPFILSRSTAPGSNLYVAHWSGDNFSSFQHLRFSIASLFNFNLFGIPMTGSDICGFMGSASEELCARWYQIGSLYPFSRSHNHIDFHDKYFFSFSELLRSTFKKCIFFRYKILKYFYSLFIKNFDNDNNTTETKHGSGSIIKPLFYEFSNDGKLYLENILEESFMIGDSLLVVGIFEENIHERQFYFPREIWYDLRDYKIINALNESNNQLFNITAPLDEIAPIYLRGGHVVFLNDIDEHFELRNVKSLNNIFNLIVGIKVIENNPVYNKSTADGYIPNIKDYNNFNELKMCIEKLHKCLTKITIQIERDVINFNDDDVYIIKIKFHNEGDYSPDTILISKLTLLGLQINKINRITISKQHELRILDYVTETELKSSNLDIKNNSLILEFGEKLKVGKSVEYIIKINI